MSTERVDQKHLEQRLNKVEIGLAKIDRVVKYEGTPILNRPLERLGQLSGVDRISAAAELAQSRMDLQSKLRQIYEEKAKPVLIGQREKLQSQLAAEEKVPPINSFDQTESAVLASLILSRDGAKIKQEEGISYEFDLSALAKFICHELVNNYTSPTRIPLDQLAIIRSDVIKKVSAIVDGGNRDDIGNQEPLVKDLLTELCAQVQDEFNGYFGQFLTESPTLIGRSYRSVVEPETVERVWILPKRNGNGHAKAESVIAESVQPQEARVEVEAEAEKQLPKLKVNLETKEIQLESWESPKKFKGNITWEVFKYLAKNPQQKISTYTLAEVAKKFGSKEKNPIKDIISTLREYLEPDPKNPEIITRAGSSSTAAYILNTRVELVSEFRKPSPSTSREKDKERVKKYKEAMETYKVTLPDGQVVLIKGQIRANVLEFLVQAEKENKPVQNDEIAIVLYGRSNSQNRNNVEKYLRHVRKDLEPYGYTIFQATLAEDLRKGQRAQYSMVKVEKEETRPPEWEWEADPIALLKIVGLGLAIERVVKNKESQKIYEVTLPNGQLIPIRGRLQAKVLELLVQARKESKWIKIDETAITLYGMSSRPNRKNVEQKLRLLKKDLEPYGYMILQIVSEEELRKHQKARYTLLEIPKVTEAEPELSTRKVTQGFLETQATNPGLVEESDPLIAPKGEVPAEDLAALQELIDQGFVTPEQLALLKDKTQ